jgi:protease-4
MRFIGKVWRLLVGVKDALVLLLLLFFFGGLYSLLSVSPYKDSARSGALRLNLSGAIVEQPVRPGPFASVLGGGPATREYRVAQLIHSLDAAATDDRIHAVALDLDIFVGGGQTAITDVGAALDRVRRAGKRVVAYATGYADDGYQLAAHADEIWLDPLGGVLLTGPGRANLYYGALLQRLGVNVHVYRVGQFKSAVEPYTRSDMSPEARIAAQALVNTLWEFWQEDVSRARPRARVREWAANPQSFVDAAGGDLARAALNAGLVDRIGDRDAFGRRMAELVGNDDERVPGRYNAVRYEAWANEHDVTREDGRIGILTVAGTIEDGHAGPGTAGGDTIAEAMERGLESGDLRALVVRVDSPGGSVLASERIRRAVLAAKARGLPVVISMGSVAASGGYWVATAGDIIFAEPSTITGSIGVFGILPSFEGTLQRLSIGADGVSTTPLSGQPDVLRGPSPEASRLLQTGIDSTYRRFIQLVAEARHLPVQRVAELAQGRVWSGGAARQLGLVDRFGGLDDAVREAARRAGVDPARAEVTYLERRPGFLARLLSSDGEGGEASAAVPRDVYSRLAQQPQALLERALYEARGLLAGPAMQARCLECPAVAPVPRTGTNAGGSWLVRLFATLVR